MSGARFVRFYPSDWRSGCIGLTLEQEGFYVRVCAFIYETAQRLPFDDCRAAKMIGLHTNAYRKIHAQLVAIGKIIRAADGWTVARAERELAAATNSNRQPNGQTHQDTPGETRQDTLGDTRVETPPDTPQETTLECSEKSAKNNGPLKSLKPIANSQCENEKRASANDTVLDQRDAFVGHGVVVDCEAIRHQKFVISIDAIAIGVGGRLSRDEVKSRCLAHALQWAVEIEAGKSAVSVLPSKISNFLSSSIMGELNRAAVQDVRIQAQKTPRAPSVGAPAKPSLSELIAQQRTTGAAA